MFGVKRKLNYLSRKIQVITHMPSGRLEAKTTLFKDLFPANASLKCCATGFKFTEGPVWSTDGKFLLFSDIPSNKIYKYNHNREIELFRYPSGHSNGLTRDLQGRLIICEHSNRRVTRTEINGEISVLADSFNNRKLNSPNDVVVRHDGSIYFTDPPYGIKPEEQEQYFQGVYRIIPDDKEIKLAADDFQRPNGLAFSPDQKKIYIDDSSNLRIIGVFDVEDDGILTNGKIFADMNADEKGAPDGMKVNSEGFVFCTGARGVWVFNQSGNHLGTILTPEKPSNCAWGDDDLKTLFITAVTSIYKIRVNIPG